MDSFRRVQLVVRVFRRLTRIWVQTAPPPGAKRPDPLRQTLAQAAGGIDGGDGGGLVVPPSDQGGTPLVGGGDIWAGIIGEGGLGFRARMYITQPARATKRTRISPTRRMSEVPVSPELANAVANATAPPATLAVPFEGVTV
jgi:hypothetical protein